MNLGASHIAQDLQRHFKDLDFKGGGKSLLHLLAVRQNASSFTMEAVRYKRHGS